MAGWWVAGKNDRAGQLMYFDMSESSSVVVADLYYSLTEICRMRQSDIRNSNYSAVSSEVN